ncbi:MAG: helix-turn-helix transcriptional regulator [Oscillospiraceae bacterium]|nr:helix-turn-helix transcriptional regulator [Oscillospiraceae bacterium]
MNERIRKLRREFNLTQQEFADRLNIKRNTVATYEVGKSTPSDAAVNLICKTFNVSEKWLRTGTGEMFVPAPSNTLDALAAEFSLSDFGRTVIEKMVRLDDRQWNVISELVTSIVADISAKENEPPDVESEDNEKGYNSDIEARVARYRKQLELEASTGIFEDSIPAKTG